ncbi:hypothetical protein G7Y89_g14950 [Cudoniella acicularis]|uniref:Amidase domain-containing protein n=1 Tax=Cudoniella acicularis TaxID=354080 RepID=A0A8H4QXY7_9HELO|nr:hypothetical protein G7Y89_g14950 [Cudoniella acicularis]
MAAAPAPWIEIARLKNEEQSQRIPSEWKINTATFNFQTHDDLTQKAIWDKISILSSRDREITDENDAVDIVEKIKAGEYSVTEVTEAFCKRAAVAHQLTNCLTEIFFEKAIQRARSLDEERKANPEKELPPLFGLPISLKDSYHVPGVDATIGITSFAFDPSTSYSPLAEILVSLGAVLYCKTNVPQALMTADSENNLFGRTTNPRNRYLTAGGSTGGEGALVALRGSVLGMATDIAGSIRIPALCNGVYGFKPSSCVIPFSGQRMPYAPGWEGVGIVANAGPIATSARACSFVMWSIMKATPSNLDPSCLRIPWVDSSVLSRVEPSKLRIGVVVDDGLFTPTPPVRRGMDECSAKLSRAGATLIPIELPLMVEALTLIREMLTVNGSDYLMGIINSTGEPLIPSVGKLGLLAGSPKTMGEYFTLNEKRHEMCKIYSKLWSEHQLDAIIMPPAPHTAVPEDQWATASYTAIWNLLDYPSFVLPIGKVEKDDIADQNKGQLYNKSDREVYKLYTGPQDYLNAPIALQVEMITCASASRGPAVSKFIRDPERKINPRHLSLLRKLTFSLPFLSFHKKPLSSNASFYMFFAVVLRNALLILVPLSFFLTTYLYFYPVFHLCAFPAPEHDASAAYSNTFHQHSPFATHDPKRVAPFRLLALGDPQLEGEPPYQDPDASSFPNLEKFWKDALLLDGTKHNPLQRLRHSLHDLIDFYLDDIPEFFETYRKRLDHVGNDYYLGLIYRSMHWWTDPTHVTVLGDLVGSQWIDDKEFESRGWRYWNRVFNGGVRVDDELTSTPVHDFQNHKIIGEDAAAWKKRIINVAGNHDVGYAGDLSPERMERFVRVFGKANYELRFQMPVNRTTTAEGDKDGGEENHPIPELRIVVLNDMNLDTPAGSKEMQDETYGFLNEVITTSLDVERPAHFTLVLTHIPIYKDAGICVDGPFFDFFDGDFENGVKEQNHLSRDASKGFLEGIFGMHGNDNVPGHGFGRNGLILTGHDHEGCDIYHYINQTAPPEREWQAMRWQDASSSRINEQPGIPGLREITVRSMMGGYAGNAGLLSLWFDEESWDWKFEFANCGLGTQHIWWLVHIVDLITLGVALVYGVLVAAQKMIPVEDPTFALKLMGNGKIQELKMNGDMIKANGDEHLEMNEKLDGPEAVPKTSRSYVMSSDELLTQQDNGQTFTESYLNAVKSTTEKVALILWLKAYLEIAYLISCHVTNRLICTTWA